MNYNCNKYMITDEIAIYEIENDEGFDYYVSKGLHLVYSFGTFKGCDKSRFTEEELKNLYDNFYFDHDLELLDRIDKEV